MIKAWGEPKSFLVRFSPDMQMEIGFDTDRCVFGNFPTLGSLKDYGKNMAKTWVLVQLTDLSEYCGCRDKLEGRSLEQCADIISQRYYYLKVSELMMFFCRFKAGDYGRFYGTIDPMIIMSALNEFARQRNIILEKKQNAFTAEDELRARQIREQRQRMKQQSK